MSRLQLSYICSCYNAERFLDGFIDNLLSQDLEDFEILIVDSQSTDDSLAIARSWMAKDQRVKILQQAKRTPYGVSWLDGWKAAVGKIVTNSNSDDRSYQWRGRKVVEAATLYKMVNEVEIVGPHGEMQIRNPPPAFYYGGYETRVDGKVTAAGTPPPFTVDDMSQFFRCGVHVHWDNDELRKMVDWDRMYAAAYQYKSAFDYWLVLYFMSLGVEGVPIRSCFSIYNQRADSLEQSDKERNTFESLRAIEEFYPNGKSIRALEAETRIKSPEFYARYRAFCNQF